jgi:hypothetical protein
MVVAGMSFRTTSSPAGTYNISGRGTLGLRRKRESEEIAAIAARSIATFLPRDEALETSPESPDARGTRISAISPRLTFHIPPPYHHSMLHHARGYAYACVYPIAGWASA